MGVSPVDKVLSQCDPWETAGHWTLNRKKDIELEKVISILPTYFFA